MTAWATRLLAAGAERLVRDWAEAARLLSGPCLMPAGTIGHRIGEAALAAGAVLVVGLATGLALLFTLVCAAPLKRLAERVRNQTP